MDSKSNNTIDPDEWEHDLTAKLIFIFIIIFESLIFGIVPSKWGRCRRSEKYLSLANCFSGGVFLAIAFLHIIPETTQEYYEYLMEDTTFIPSMNRTLTSMENLSVDIKD